MGLGGFRFHETHLTLFTLQGETPGFTAKIMGRQRCNM